MVHSVAHAFGHGFHKILFYVERRFAVRKVKPVRGAENVGVDGYSVPAVSHRKNHVGGVAPHSRKREQSVESIGDFTAVIFDDGVCGCDNVFGFVVVKAATVNQFFKLLLRRGSKVAG